MSTGDPTPSTTRHDLVITRVIDAPVERVWKAWTYRKVVPLQRLEFVQRFADQAGNQLDPADLGLPAGIPREVPHVVTFTAAGDTSTELTVTERGYPSQQLVDLSRAGMEQVLDKLAESLK
jgi:uncharacterized protein YndB with AHSA1/START domain